MLPLLTLPHPYTGSRATTDRKAAHMEHMEAVERLVERLFHPTARTQTVADVRADLLALLAEVEAAAEEMATC